MRCWWPRRRQARPAATSPLGEPRGSPSAIPATLPERERAVFEMHYYLDLPQAEIAQILELHPRKVSYLWVAATEKLSEDLHA